MTRSRCENDGNDIKVNAPVSLDMAPVPFLQLFRFATRFELLLDSIGLVTAIGAGVARLIMTTFFATLIQGFVNFETEVEKAKFGDMQAKAQIPIAAKQFRHAAAERAIYLIYLSLGVFVCSFIYTSVWNYTGEMSSKRLRQHYFRAVLRQDISLFDRLSAGEIATRVYTNTYLVQQGISDKVPMVANMLGAFITGFVLAYARSWRLALALSALIPFLLGTTLIVNKFVLKHTMASLKHTADSGTVAEETISTIRTAQAFGIQARLAEKFDTHVNQSKKIDAKAAIVQGVSLGVFSFAMYATYALAFSFGTTLINKGLADVASVVNVLLAIFLGTVSVSMLAPKMQAIIRGQGAASKLYEIIDRVPDIDSADTGGLKPETAEGHITFDHVNFAYPSRPGIPILKDLSVTFPAGKSVALVGASGSGKSTIISLIERFYDPSDGSIKLDGVDIKDINIKWLRAQIGLVSQEPILFGTTIQENVEYGLIGTQYETASEEKKFALVKKACADANADDFIQNLPLGYHTIVGGRGLSLSGGQRQRIAIARAIISNPKILLLDEATSAIDTRSENVVQDVLSNASGGRTTIIIAHRLSTIKDADRIFVMSDGVIAEQGTHNELLQDGNSRYSNFVAAQKLHKIQEVATVIDPGSATAVESAAEDSNKKETEYFSENSPKQNETNKHDSEEDHHIFYLLGRMGQINRDDWSKYGCGSISAALTGMIYPTFGVVYAKGITAFSKLDPHQRRLDSDFVALLFFLIAITSTLTTAIQSHMFASTSATLAAKLRSMGFRAILKQDIEFFDKTENNSGKLTSSLNANPQKVNGLAGITMGVIIQNMATLVSGSILGLIYSFKLGLVALACIPIIVSTGYIGIQVVAKKERTDREGYESSARSACEAAAAIQTVASLTLEDRCLKQYSQSLRESLTRSARVVIWSSILFAISQSVSYFVVALIYWYGSHLVSIFQITNFAFFVVLMSATSGVIQATSVFTFLPTISAAKDAGSAIIKLIDSGPKTDGNSTEEEAVLIENLRGKIRLQHIHFRYPTRPDVLVLRDLSLIIESGTYVALVGASGSGKSTVIQLIERFYNPSAGQIYFDNELVTELNIQEYRKHIALVSQEPTLYSGTVRFNILLGATKPISEVSQEEIEQACRDANILDLINSLSNGFDTEIGYKACRLSGGQKQRIAIARALIRNPKVLLLDEATSALDSNSENVVQEALDRASKGRTTIAISHRLSTIQNADCIHFIKNGQICESGTHDELLQKRGEYYDHVQLQALASTEM